MLANRLRMATAAADGIEFVAYATTINGSSGETLTINKPTGTVDGDLMIAVMNCMSSSGTQTWTGDTGWTEIYDQASAPTLRIAYKVASSEGASYTFTNSYALAECGGTILAYRGAAYDVIGSVVTATGTTPIVAPSITAVGGVLLGCFADRIAGVTFTTPSGMASVSSNSVVRPSFNVFSETIVAGATGTRTSTPSGGAGSITGGILLAIKPA